MESMKRKASVFYCLLCVLCITWAKNDLNHGVVVDKDEQLIGIREIHSLPSFVDYSDVAILSFTIPAGSELVQLAIMSYSYTRSLLFSCQEQNLTVHIKHGSIPVVSPDNTRLPNTFAEIIRSDTITLHLNSNEKYNLLNFTNPKPGHWFAIAYVDWIDPWVHKITQNGLYADCQTNLFAYMKVKSVYDTIDRHAKQIHVNASVKTANLLKFHAHFNRTNLVIAHAHFDIALTTLYIGYNDSIPTTQYYWQKIVVNAPNIMFTINSVSEFFVLFVVRSLRDVTMSIVPGNDTKLSRNEFLLNITTKTHESYVKNDTNIDKIGKQIESIDQVTQSTLETGIIYDMFNLVLYTADTPLSFTYLVNTRNYTNFKLPQTINLTKEINVFKYVTNYEQVGTTLAINVTTITSQTPTNQYFYVTGCINHNSYALPLHGELCLLVNNRDTLIVTNSSINAQNTTVYVPFPEIGAWYLTLRVTKANYTMDNVTNATLCRDNMAKCRIYCERYNLPACAVTCSRLLQNLSVCLMRDGLALDTWNSLDVSQHLNARDETSNTSRTSHISQVIRDLDVWNVTIQLAITTPGCIVHDCNGHGFCTRYVTEISTYMFTCVCSNHWIGWECTDDRYVQKNYTLLVGSVVLVLSNMAFFASVYVAFTRKYYAESIIYASLMIISALYHACDSGGDAYRYCLFQSPNTLQFCDFYFGMLTFWMTIIAIADVDLEWRFRSICLVCGTVLCAVLTQYDRYSLITPTLPFVVSLLILAYKWMQKYRNTTGTFPPKAYLNKASIGAALFIVALVLYSFFETRANYAYVHAVWHILVAAAICFLLPEPDVYYDKN